MAVDIKDMTINKPIKVGPWTLINRFHAAPMVKNFCDEFGYPTDRVVAHYRRLAEGKWGAITVSATRVHHTGSAFGRMMGLYSYKHRLGHTEVVENMRTVSPETRLGVQLVHTGANANPLLSDWQPDKDGDFVLCPSGLWPQDGSYRSSVIRGMSTKEADKAVEWHAKAAGRAKDAGYDYVMLHCAHGFLIMEYLSAYWNKRTDAYGDLLYFPLRCLEEIKNECGKGFPVVPRISAHEWLKESPAARILFEWGGYESRDGLTPDFLADKVMPAFEKVGNVVWWDLSAGNVYFSFDYQIPPLYHPRGLYLDSIRRCRPATKLPISCAGKMGVDPMLAARIIEEGTIDMVSLGRPEYCDYDYPVKVKEGRLEDLRLCTSCNWCTEDLFKDIQVRCCLNPEYGWEMTYRITPAVKKKKIVVVGGGPAGLKASKILAQRGHEVTLIEKEQEFGGQINLSAKMPPTADWRNAIIYLEAQIKKYGVNVMMGQTATADMVLGMNPEAVIIATGSRAIKEDIPGADKPHVVTLDEAILMGPDEAEDNVVIIGAKKWGSELALWWGDEEKDITLLDETAGLAGGDMKDTERMCCLPVMLRERNVKLSMGVEILSIEDNGVKFKDADGNEQFAPGGTVVCAVKRERVRGLYDQLYGKVPELYDVGDCRRPLYVFYAIHGAAQIANKI